MGVIIDIFRVLGACTALMMILSPIPIVYRIYTTKETGHMSIFPLIAVLANCHAWMFYGYLGGNIFPVFVTFLFGDFICVVYVAIFYYYSSERSKANKLLLAYGIFMTADTVYAFVGGYGYTGQTRHEVAQCSGFFGVAATLVLYTSPLEKIMLVFHHKSGVFVPIHMVIAGLTNNVTWVIYTSLDGNWMMFAPNLVAMIAGIFQAFVYFFLFNPKTHPLAPDWNSNVNAEDTATTVAPAMRPGYDLESQDFVEIKTPKHASSEISAEV